ncbi:MAG: hypothetical protein HY320_08890, partial [Armatimonadetes bacterium]|nr:hypothetical protein [Armatimonadota bacterium]
MTSVIPWIDQLARMSHLLGPGLGAELALIASGLPPVTRLEQEFPRPRVEDIDATVAGEFARPEIEGRLRPGLRVAVAVGSRGIARLPQIITAVVRELKARGTRPFIVPAMGSHGGATAEGQAELLAGYGITEVAIGAPVVSSLETILLGHVMGDVP